MKWCSESEKKIDLLIFTGLVFFGCFFFSFTLKPTCNLLSLTFVNTVMKAVPSDRFEVNGEEASSGSFPWDRTAPQNRWCQRGHRIPWGILMQNHDMRFAMPGNCFKLWKKKNAQFGSFKATIKVLTCGVMFVWAWPRVSNKSRSLKVRLQIEGLT